MRTIFHVDMDAFYTSIEQRDHPEYRGKPVIVGADPKDGKGRGVVAAASYEARAFGVHSAMPIGRAYRMCPQGIYLRGNMRKYAEVSARIFAILESYTDLVEPISIDEAFLDVSAISVPEKARSLATEIKENVYSSERLKASIGAAPNKFLAKIASDLKKPDGLVVVLAGEELELLRDLPVERLWGVGPKTAEDLHRAGLQRIGELWNLSSRHPVMARMGKHGEHLLELSRGIDDRPVVPHHEPKSIGHETTFEEDVDDAGLVRRTLLSLSDGVAARLRKRGLLGQTVTLKFRDESFVTLTRSRTFRDALDEGSVIYQTALELLQKIESKGRKIRLLGVSVSGLRRSGDPHQLSLFGREDEKQKLSRARDALEARFGRGAVRRASLGDGERLHPLAPSGDEP